MVNQDLAHQSRGNSKEVSSALPARHFLLNHSQVAFMNQSSWLQCVTGALLLDVAGGNFS